ncbi:MAG: hypothetical protein HYU36_22635 [Planctomycetes bacterium]|nr:hypothetical protein [Planctomycetota bacterium]
MRTVIDRLIDEFHERAFPDLMRRNRTLQRIPAKTSVVVGMGRVGKTWFCYQDMLQFISHGEDKAKLLYINFEDERLLPCGSGDPAARFSVNKFYNTLRSQQISCTKNDLYGFLEFLEETYIVHTVPMYSASERVRQMNPKKVFAIEVLNHHR